MHVCLSVCLSVCVCMYVCMYVCIHICIYIHITYLHNYVPTYLHAYIYTSMYVHIDVRMYICIYIYIYMYTRIWVGSASRPLPTPCLRPRPLLAAAFRPEHFQPGVVTCRCGRRPMVKVPLKGSFKGDAYTDVDSDMAVSGIFGCC